MLSQRWIQHNGKVRWHIEIPFKNWLSMFCGESSEAGYWYLLLSLPVTRVQSQAYRAAVREQNTVLVKISVVLNVEEMNGYIAQHMQRIHSRILFWIWMPEYLMPGEGSPFPRLLGDQL